MAEIGPVYYKMAAFEAVQIRSTLRYWMIDTWRFERTKLFRNMGHQSSGDGS